MRECHILPNDRPSLLFWNVIDGDFFPGSRVVRSQFGQIYLQSNFDLLCEGTGWEYGLHLRHHRRRHHTAVRTDCVHLLTNAGHDREILREIGRQNARDAVCVHVLQLAHICQQSAAKPMPVAKRNACNFILTSCHMT